MRFVYLFLFFSLLYPCFLLSQGITSGEIRGRVTNEKKQVLENATILAVHLPSGTKYGTTTRADGRYSLTGLRIGGPYKVIVSYLGFSPGKVENITVLLGSAEKIDFELKESGIETGQVVITGENAPGINPKRTGPAATIDINVIQTLPTISRTITDFIRLTPELKNNCFMGQDNKLNNLTVDGAYFNNSYGIAGMPGERTGVAPISLDALEQIQVNGAPFDVRQGNFVGAGINMVTKSGSNEFKSAIYYETRNESMVGTEAANSTFNPGTFKFNLIGANASGPIIKDKLFFFASVESEKNTRPGTTFLANNGTQPAGGNITRVLKNDLNGLSSFLKKNFGYETGAFEGYDFNIPALRFSLKLDYNIEEKNRISICYNHLNSKSDLMISNSTSLGFGNRRGSIYSLNFQNSNYSLLENIRSLIVEWNSVLSNNVSNNMVAGYSYHDESRENPGKLFPFVDILKDGSTYTSFGTEPFSPFNGLTYSIIQFQNNLSWFLQSHTLLFGICLERFQSEDYFFPGAQSVYVYNSLNDFYTDANDYLANPNRTKSPVNLKRFQYRYSNIPGQIRPQQFLKVTYGGLYAQDEWNAKENLNLTFGIRVDVPFFDNTGYKNKEVEELSFKDDKGKTVKYSTDKLPNANPLFSFRLGFNWDPFNNKNIQLRGGSGIFTGQPPFILISNQVGNNGMLTGFESIDGTAQSPLFNRPFNPNIETYKPANVNGEPAQKYELALTDPDFKFPQVWRTNLAYDQKLPFGLLSTVEFLYNKDINGIHYINANLSSPDSYFTGPDNRPRWTSGNKIYSKIDNAVVLKNQNEGYSWSISASIEKAFQDGFFAKMGYAYGQSKNTVDATTTASVTWMYNVQSGDPNNPGVSYSMYNPDHRFFTALSYRFEYLDFGATTLSMFWETSTIGRSSYVYTGDFNGDGVYNNDLIYVPRDKSEMNFKEYTSGGVTFSADAQKEAWDKYIEQDEYLKLRRGEYAERNGVILPLLTRVDLSISQEFYTNIFGKGNNFTLRLDIINFTNLLKKDWGVSQTLNTTQPLIAQTPDSQGKPVYTLRAINNKLIDQSFTNTCTINDVYKIQFAVKWMIN